MSISDAPSAQGASRRAEHTARPARCGGDKMTTMAKIPESTQTSLRQRLLARVEERWPQIDELHTRYRAGFAYIDATLDDGEHLKLFRLTYAGSASRWGFSIYRASHDDYHQAALPDGWPSGSPEDALDTACGLYLGDPTAWLTNPRRTSGDTH